MELELSGDELRKTVSGRTHAHQCVSDGGQKPRKDDRSEHGMDPGLTVRLAATIGANRAKVWAALTDPSAIMRYMPCAGVASEWREGSSIVWKREVMGKSIEETGRILRIDPRTTLQYTHTHPLWGGRWVESDHTLTIRLSGTGETTDVSLTDDNYPSMQLLEDAKRAWRAILDGLRQHVER
jgi:uncharacterized protein YndB with AHSA1/START domain